MKALIFTLALSQASLAIADQTIDLNKIVRIEVEDDEVQADVKLLRKKVNRLEKAVRQLQLQVFKLQESNFYAQTKSQPQQAKPTSVSCYLKTPFDGTHTHTAKTKTEAMGEVLAKCESAGGGIFCKEEKVKCE